MNETTSNQLKRILLRQASLENREKSEYKKIRNAIFEVIKEITKNDREIQPLASQVVNALSEYMEEKLPSLSRLAIIPLGSLSTDAWKIKKTLGRKSSTDLDWAMTFDLPDEIDFPDENNILSVYEKYSGITQELFNSMKEEVSNISENQLQSCDVYVPGILGWGLNLRNKKDANKIIDSINNNQQSDYLDLIVRFFTPSFPQEVNEKNLELFFLTLKQEDPIIQNKIISLIVKKMVKHLSLKPSHIDENYHSKKKHILSDSEQRQINLISQISSLSSAIIEEKIRKTISNKRIFT